MRAYGLLILLVGALASCTSDLDAPFNYQVATTTGPGALSLDCAMPPLGAVGAEYLHALEASGGEGSYVFSGTLPAGLVLDGNTGEITGIPTTAESATFDVTVTDAADTTATTTCTIEVAPSLALGLDLEARPYCVAGTAGNTLLEQVVPGTGDGTAITCDHTGTSGNGSLPAGISIDPTTCEVVGTVTETRVGTWAFAVRGTQSGAEVFLPYCVTQDTPAAGTYPLAIDHSGMTEQLLVPWTNTFNPDATIAIGTPGDPLFTVTDNGDCPGGQCTFSFSFFINASPFELQDGAGQDKAIVTGAMLGDDGTNDILTHGVSLSTNAPVSDAFKNRPWVVNLDLDYCFSEDAQDCDTEANPNPAFNSFLEFSVIMVPDGG
jgi:hypothetical protein